MTYYLFNYVHGSWAFLRLGYQINYYHYISGSRHARGSLLIAQLYMFRLHILLLRILLQPEAKAVSPLR